MKLNKIKCSHSPETPPTIRRISNSCKFAEYSHVVECEYELRHIPTNWDAFTAIWRQEALVNTVNHLIFRDGQILIFHLTPKWNIRAM